MAYFHRFISIDTLHFHGVLVSMLSSESVDPGLNPGLGIWDMAHIPVHSPYSGWLKNGYLAEPEQGKV